MFEFVRTAFGNLLKVNTDNVMTDKQFIEMEIRNFKISQKRKEMLDGERYYAGHHDILTRKRTVIGPNGDLVEVDNLPNNRIVDNQYKKMVDQKNNYLLGQPISIQSDNEEYAKLLNEVFNKKFMRLIKSIGEDSLNCAVGWLYPYYDEQGEFSFKRFRPYEIIPEWKDNEHTILDCAIRVYQVLSYVGRQERIIDKVEVYNDSGIDYYEMTDGGSLKPVEPYHENYFSVNGEGYNWTRIPLIPFKYNSKEIPLIKMVKSLQDGLNTIESNFQNQMEEDPRNTILVLVNYDGENLGEFRRNLATYGAVKVKTVDGTGGDLRTLQVEVNSQNYQVIQELFKKAIIENAMGYDAKDDRLNGNPNQMNIQSMYSDIDLDANNMETEYQAAFEELIWFINCHLSNTGHGDYEGEKVSVIFNRDMLISEGDVIDNCQKSVGLLSDETIISMHPWVDDPAAELERLKQQKQEEMEQYSEAFNNPDNANTGDE